MLNYIPQCNFRRKDNLASGDPEKMVVGAELSCEFLAVQRAINSASPGLYTITTDFRAKDSLPHGNNAKLVRGTALSTEFTNIATAIATLGGSYTPVYDGATLDSGTAEITGDPIQDEFDAISLAIDAIRDANGSFYIVTDETDGSYSFILTEDSDETFEITEGSL
jgi:hypothetical protein